MNESDRPQGHYFEEFEVGYAIETPGRTITETDVVMFAGLSGDWTQLHTDAVFAQETPYGERIAHGLLLLSIASGLAARLGFIEGTALAFRELTWKFSKPVMFGDTVRVRFEVQETKPARRLGGGTVLFKVTVLNQKDEAVQRGTWKVLIKSRPEAA